VSEAMRPTQMELLQVADVTIERDANGEVCGALVNAPIVKQAGTPARDYMMECRLSESVSKAMADQLDFLASVYGSPPPPDWAIFCVRRRQDGVGYRMEKGAINIANQISRTRILIASASAALEADELFTRRFKHTKLTHLAMLGAPLDVLARAGFQSTTISLRRYVNLTEEAFEVYERQMSGAHEGIFQSFRGKIVPREMTTNPEPENRIVDPLMNDDVGACSGHLCNVLTPIGCYVCPRFEAFEDGPHHLVEHVLVQRRDRAIRLNLPMESIERDDDLLVAVRQVITSIRERGPHGAGTD